jgi:hypothetical protein
LAVQNWAKEYSFFKKQYCKEKKTSPGQNTILRCSQVLSFTAATSATGLQKLLSSKAKCNPEPIISMKRSPAISHLSMPLSIVERKLDILIFPERIFKKLSFKEL